MPRLLEQAFAAAAALPEAEQDAVASRLLKDIKAETKWDATFAATADGLAKLAAKAVADFRAGRTSPQDDDDRESRTGLEVFGGCSARCQTTFSEQPAEAMHCGGTIQTTQACNSNLFTPLSQFFPPASPLDGELALSVNIWFFIGSHAAYDRLLSQR